MRLTKTRSFRLDGKRALVAGASSRIDRAVYCATNHAVEGFTKAMAIEWGKAGIRVHTICPSFILTDLTRPTVEEPQKRARASE